MSDADAAEGRRSESAPPCENCDAPLHGPFCHDCGQRDGDLDRPLLGLLREWFGNFFAFDARIWRTLGPLFDRPGLVTEEYLAGRRVRYVPPLRLYLFSSLAMFLALAWSGYSIVSSVGPDEGRTIVSFYQVGQTEDDAQDPAGDDGAPTPEEQATTTTDGDPSDDPNGDPSDDPDDATGKLARFFERDPAEVNRLYRERLAQTLILLAAVFAFLTWILFRHRHRRYLQHLVLAVHVHAAAFLAIAAIQSLDALLGESFGWLTGAGEALFFLALPVYLFLALRRVHGTGVWATLWRLVVLLVLYFSAFAIVLGLTLVLMIALS